MDHPPNLLYGYLTTLKSLLIVDNLFLLFYTKSIGCVPVVRRDMLQPPFSEAETVQSAFSLPAVYMFAPVFVTGYLPPNQCSELSLARAQLEFQTPPEESVIAELPLPSPPPPAPAQAAPEISVVLSVGNMCQLIAIPTYSGEIAHCLCHTVIRWGEFDANCSTLPR